MIWMKREAARIVKNQNQDFYNVKIFWGRSNSTAGRTFALHVTNPGSIPDIPYVPESARSNFWALLGVPPPNKTKQNILLTITSTSG